MLQAVFWISVAFIVYAYAGYPALLAILSRFRNRPVHRADIQPRVSLIITAYNEASRIENKLRNCTELIYPRDKLEIIVASDSSTDATDQIVQSYSEDGVMLVRAPERRGKEYAQQCALRNASGEIYVFSDVATILDPPSIQNIVKNFADPTVGCVSSVDRVLGHGGSSGEGAYVKYEMLLRSLEGRVNSLVGLSGSFFACRKDVAFPWAANLQSDFNTLLNSIRKGLRGVSDPTCIGYYKNIRVEEQEFGRKVRTIVRGIAVLMANLDLLNPFRYGPFSWQLFSHKLCRWLVPLFLLTAIISSAFLSSQQPLYAFILAAQVSFYGAAGSCFVNKRLLSRQLIKVPFYFTIANLAIVVAWCEYLAGKRYAMWQPSHR
jgi:glycosyltransferase involved in cell wall biosynthesis